MPDPQPHHVADLLQQLRAWDAVAKPGWELPISAGDVAVLIRTLHAYEAARRDAELFVWWFADTNKSPEFINEYLRGVREHWTVDQWRASIRVAIEGK